MKIAVLSGKGGTGKTFVSTNLATALGHSTYIDCDVEEPNGKLFFKPIIVNEKDVTINYPVQNTKLCNGCRRCIEFCKFHALALIKNRLIVFNDVCHSCEGCKLVCPTNAIEMHKRIIGKIEEGKYKNIKTLTGILNTGEATGVPIIQELLRYKEYSDVVVDCPPGSSCAVIESIKDVDYCVLVTEPTTFGICNLDMVFRLTKILNKKCGVVINKNIDNENIAYDYCKNNDIKILGSIPFGKEIAKIITNGEIAYQNNAEIKRIFDMILSAIKNEVQL